MGGHGPVNKTKYHSIDEIPDELIPRFSKRDPGNRIYETRRWVNFKKKQILFQQNDGIPPWKRTRLGRFTYYTCWVSTIASFALAMYKINYYTNKGK